MEKIVKRKDKLIAISVTFLVTIIMLCGYSIVFAKYYAARNNKGIAIASNFYFNSDKLNKIDKIIDIAKEDWETDINWIKDNLSDKIMVYTNNERWSNGYYDFDVMIQNYDSHILYNQADMKVGYKVEFMLLDEPVGATYQIVYKDNDKDKTENLSYGSVVKLGGELEGGTLNSSTYKIRMTLTDTIDKYKQARVLAIAYPDSPDYLKQENNQQYLMVGVFAGTASMMELTIASQNFEVVDEYSDFNLKYVDYINDLSGYIYNIKTEGDVVKNENTAIKQEITVRWKTDYLNISKYDEYYDESRISTGTEDGVNYTYMTIDVLPYTSINLTFYKTEKFIQEMKSGGELYLDYENFKKLVYAYK